MKTKYQRGTVLILVLIITTLTTVIVTAAMRRSLSHMRLLSKHQESIQVEQANESAIGYFLQGMTTSSVKAYINAGLGSFGSNNVFLGQKPIVVFTKYLDFKNGYHIFLTESSAEGNHFVLTATQGWRVDEGLTNIETTSWQVGS